MQPVNLIESLAVQNDKRILLVVLDGLGGLPRNDKTELESAWIPNLDRLAARSGLGLLTPVEVGVTPGSGPAHLALFGYDPVAHQVGRGVLEALGIDLDVRQGDLCARANFCDLGPDGTVTDRRAGRIPTQLCQELCGELQRAIGRIDDVEVIIRPGKEHRFVVVFRGEGLAGGLTDSDPQHEGARPLPVAAEDPQDAAAVRSAKVANSFVVKCAEVIGKRERANGVLLRGIALPPRIASLAERFKLRPACVAAYPMYRGLARLVGMDVLPCGSSWESEVDTVAKYREKYDFFFLHFKETDRAGEDGNFELKQELLERFDEEVVPRLKDLAFDVFCITGDHSTPAALGGHSWHPVPVLVNSRYCRPQVDVETFGERACLRGTVGRMHSVHLMNILLAHSLKLKKFGA
jgi:2,3-bisphosphoglycerate-independent phosphoglycerate mutase